MVAAVATASAFYLQMVRNRSRALEYEQRLSQNREAIQRLTEQVRAVQANAKNQAPTPESIRSSLKTFEEEYLSDPDSGMLAVITEIDKTARDAGVIRSDVTFNPIEESEIKARGEVFTGRGGRGFYPGLKMSFTVSGDYPNIKTFLVGLETSRMLLIVESLNLKSVEERAVARRPGAAAAAGASISLEINLSAYYRRRNEA
jgi:hypothetical protein